MNTTTKRFVITATVVAAASSGIGVIATSSSGATHRAVPTKSQPYDPGQCIRSNHGDWNACNVGSSGQGARSDRTVSRSSKPYTPDQCILNNHGDWNACNVGNSGSGDRPYRQVRV